jgi:hypothetical protein
VNPAFGKRLLVVWLGLSAITLVSLWVGSRDARDAFTPNAAVTASAISMALIKARFILREFMEVRHAPVVLGRLTDAWLLLTAVTLLGTYFGAMGFSTG